MATFEKTLFVTGGAGFIGSNYLNRYVPLRPTWQFINIDALTYAGTERNLTVSQEPNYVFEQTDIRDHAALTNLFAKYQPTAIIHFAAESHVDVSLVNPGIFVETNVLGTQNLLALAKDYGIERFHYMSTDEVYGALAKDDAPFTEQSPLRPRNPYSASKASADLLVHAYHETFGLNTVTTRCSNNYGPHQDVSKLIPSFLTKLKAGEAVPLYGEGAQMREWLFVEDCVDAVQAVFERGTNGGVYNIGSGYELTNYELTHKLLAAFGQDDSFISYVPDRQGHDFRYALDTSKIERELGWQPRVDFSDGLSRTIAYYMGDYES